jgi:hypothetical protein
VKELIVALGLELNQPSQRIVRIGAKLGNVRTGRSFRMSPEVSSCSSQLSPLTGDLFGCVPAYR